MRVIVAPLCLVIALTTQQKPADPYASAVAKYVAGDVEGACRALSRVPQLDVRRGIQMYLTEFESAGSDVARRQLAWRQLEAIAMVHTDCPQVFYVNQDAALFDVDMAHLALVMARRLVTHELGDANDLDVRRAREFLPRWYALATSVLLSCFSDQNAMRLIDEGVKLFPEDPTVLYWRGLVMEFTAVWVGSRPMGPTDPKLLSTPGSRSSYGSGPLAVAFSWSPTEEAFRRVIQKNPGQLEAHLHLGYALYRLRKYDEAKAEYELARDRSTDAFVVYMADLLLGRLEEDRHDLDAAARDYDHALATMPGAQNAYIGLASVAARLGNSQRAQELTTRLASIPDAQRVRDPWWAFHTTREPAADLQWLRAAVRQ
jgi:tetratricopeptide (TPR) repeat protein